MAVRLLAPGLPRRATWRRFARETSASHLAAVDEFAADDVAAILADITVAKPLNKTIDVAGPEPTRMGDLVRQCLTANRDPRKVTTDSSALDYGTQVNDESLSPGPDSRLGPTRFAEWLTRAEA